MRNRLPLLFTMALAVALPRYAEAQSGCWIRIAVSDAGSLKAVDEGDNATVGFVLFSAAPLDSPRQTVYVESNHLPLLHFEAIHREISIFYGEPVTHTLWGYIGRKQGTALLKRIASTPAGTELTLYFGKVEMHLAVSASSRPVDMLAPCGRLMSRSWRYQGIVRHGDAPAEPEY